MCQAGGTRRGTPPPPGPIPISAHAATVDVAHSRTPRIGGNRGIMRNSIVRSGHGRVPICADPLIAHGSPTTTHHAHQKSPSFQQKPAAVLQRPHPPMCNTNDNHTHQAHHTPHNQPTTNSNRNRTDLDAELDRSRHGVRPISVRNSTDLDAETDRSRRGNGPISRNRMRYSQAPHQTDHPH